MKTLRCWLVVLTIVVPQIFSAAIPDRLTDEEFWRTITEFSESGGEFPSENFVSNEQNFQVVLSRLKQRVAPGQAYLGVGPEQNFAYIAALRPRIVFIIDIRRQNMIEHLVYKSIFELSSNRSEFVSLLFSRSPSGAVNEAASAQVLFAAFQGSKLDEETLAKNVKTIREHLVNTHGFKLSVSDLSMLEYVLQMFALHGPGINYTSTIGNVGASRQSRGSIPDYVGLMTATDESGVNQSFLGSEATFRAVRDLEQRNLIVPIVGDFGGTKAIAAVARYLKEHEVTVGVFYLSNVEQYLFGPAIGRGPINGGARNFYKNAAELPLTPSSTFIRSSNGPGTQTYAGFQSWISPMMETIRAFEDEQATTYSEVLTLSK